MYVHKQDQEIYSIDECFLELTHYQKIIKNTEDARQMKAQIRDKYGSKGISVGAGSLGGDWTMQRSNLTPNYFTAEGMIKINN
ncbi:impB/mucB/samB family protein [Acinetobacter sp. 1000160]|nr:impB/mucB/samB family protein [Acinetobacter sp. 1000160]